MAEAERLARAGVRELNLIGQDTTGYGTDLPGRPTLADLLAALDQVSGLNWIRVQYTYPRLWGDRLISVWAGAKRVVPYVDMPLQHIAAEQLRTMARGMTARDTRALVRRIKAGIPGVAFRTNFIVGFPGETDAEFDELCRYVEEEPFENVVVFAYEREPDTPAHEISKPCPAHRPPAPRAPLAPRSPLARARSIGRECVTVSWTARAGGKCRDLPAPVGRAHAGLVLGGGLGVWSGRRLTRETLIRCASSSLAYDLFARTEAPSRDGFVSWGLPMRGPCSRGAVAISPWRSDRAKTSGTERSPTMWTPPSRGGGRSSSRSCGCAGRAFHHQSQM